MHTYDFVRTKFLGCIDNQILDGIKIRKTDVQGYIQQLLHEDEYEMTDYPESVLWDSNPLAQMAS